MRIAIPDFAGEVSCSINTAYLKYVQSAGYEPVLFSQFNDVQNIAEQCDGLLLPGGIDVEPTFYGEDNFGSHNCNPEKDNFEREALRAFVILGKKSFGICRGFQLMVREFIHEFDKECKFMAFYQHVAGHALANDRNAKRSTPTHSVKANVTSLYGVENHKKAKIFVNSIHHQALIVSNKHLGVAINNDNSMKILAHTEFGAPTTPANLLIAEAVDITLAGVQLRGVQWHPEELMDVALLHTFFSEEQHEIQLPKEVKHV